MKRPRPEQRGFVLLSVLLIIVLMIAAVALTLLDAESGLREAGSARSQTMVRAALMHGLNVAMDEIQRMDPATLADAQPEGPMDIFAGPSAADAVGLPVNNNVGELSYPTGGELAGAMRVRMGLALGQRTRAPAGEDVRSAYGQVVEVQLSVSNNRFGSGAEERVAVGIQVPHTASHSN